MLRRIKSLIQLIFSLALIISFSLSCASENKNHLTQSKSNKKVSPAEKKFELVQPGRNLVVNLGDEVPLSFHTKTELPIDSCKLFSQGAEQIIHIESDLIYRWNTLDAGVGIKNLRLVVYYSDSITESHTSSITILANMAPEKLNYKVIRQFYHDDKAFTQGLIYHNGYLYESTGQRRESSLRKVNPKNGQVEQIYKFEDSYFGEGISLIGNEIYMLTYTSRLGFVFDLNTFELIRKFNLQTNQGWGLTTDGKDLILSDGSSTIYFYDPVTFTQKKQLEVCDNTGLINNINELEYNHLGIFANVWGQNRILLIDPTSGVVKQELDLTDLTPPNLPGNSNIVLNGIAYNKDLDTYFVTGKYWPIMYEIALLK